MTDSGSLSEKLKSMGVRLGPKPTPAAPPKQKARSYDIEKVIQGSDIRTRYGPAFLVKETYPLDYIHGRLALCSQHDLDMLAAWAGTPRITGAGGQNVVFLDTETSGLAGGTGTYAFLIGIGYLTNSGFELLQFFMRDPDQEPALLDALNQWLVNFDVVVTFNGKSFDIPLLNTRFEMNRIETPFERFQHLDVLQIARKLWRDRLPSRALPELEREIVQFYRTEEEVPGWMIPQMYFDYLRSGDARPLSGIFYHNARDILSLAALYGHIGAMLKDPLAQAADYGLDLAAIARLYEEMGWIEEAAQLYECCLERRDLPEPFFLKTMERFALLRRRRGDWDSATQLWRKAAEHGELGACIELAKFYEHRARDYEEALNWARKALDILDSVHHFSRGARRAIERDIERRIGRLYRRVYRDYGSFE